MRLFASVTVPPIPARVLPRRALAVRRTDWRAVAAHAVVSPWLLGSLLAVGAGLRLARYLADRALWLDESYLALNLMNRSYSQLLGTLDFGQGAPAGFLLAQKLVVETLGDGERALRLLPFVAGIVSLLLFFLVARALLTPAAVPLALLLFAVGEPFLVYSAELKQYGFDVAIALGLLYLLLRTIEAPRFEARHALVFAATGAGAVWFSHPSVFVLTGVGAGLLVALLRRGDRRGIVLLAIPFAVWLLSFFAMYVATLRDIQHVEAATAQAAGGAKSLVRNVFMIFFDLGLTKWAGAGTASVVGVFGVVTLSRSARNRPLLAAGAAMFLALLVAGYLGKYPVGHRFILFVLPVAVLCFAEGAVRLLRVLPRDLAVAFAVILAVTVLLPPVNSSARALVSPPLKEEIRPVLAYVAERWREGDVLYVNGSSQYAFRYYLECSTCRDEVPPRLRAAFRTRPNSGRLQTTPALVSETDALVIGRQKRVLYALDVERLRGHDRVWVLLTHRFLTRNTHLSAFIQHGVERECSPEHGRAFACLYDLARRPRDLASPLGRAAHTDP